MAGDDADRGKLLLDMASTRLQEARRLMERRRIGPLNTDAVRTCAVRWSACTREASEGHQLLSAAYRQDGSLGPIETLTAFSRQQQLTWTELRGQLPSQLSRLGDQVSSVFAAIDREVEPLQGLLPAGPAPGSRAGFARLGCAAPAVPVRRRRRPARPGPPATTGGTAGAAPARPPRRPRGRGCSAAPVCSTHRPPRAVSRRAPVAGRATAGRRRTSACPRCCRACCRASASAAATDVAPHRRRRPGSSRPGRRRHPFRRRPTSAAPATCTACAGSSRAPGPSG